MTPAAGLTKAADICVEQGIQPAQGFVGRVLRAAALAIAIR
jgi:hypothetical protein